MIEIRKPDQMLIKILPPVAPRPGITYIPSQYALSFSHNGRDYVFNNLTKQCIEGILPEEARAGEGFDDLIAAQFLVPQDRDECAYYNQVSSLMRAFSRKKGIRAYTILPTLGCNARCVYCYEEGMKAVTMTPETVEQTIRFIIDTHSGDKVKLMWFGGEPLLKVDAIDRICEGMREAGIDYHSTMISNGSLITPDIVSKMKGDWHLTFIQISMDGAEEDYIARKRFLADRGSAVSGSNLSGRGSQDHYRKVMEAVSAMSEAGIRVTIRCNVDEDNWNGIPRFLEDLKAGVANKENVKVYIALLNAVRMSDEDLAMWKKVKASGHLITEAGFEITPFMDFSPGFRTNRCMADGGSVVIGPDGSLYLCEHCPPESRFGDIFRGTTDEAAKREFTRVDRTREKCKTCAFLPNCTSFSHCPVYDTHCRELYEMTAFAGLKRMVEKKEEEDGENPAC